MTSKVTVCAHAGWPIRIERIEQNSSGSYEVVPAGKECTFYVHSTCDLLIHEIQPDEREHVGPIVRTTGLNFGDALRCLKLGSRVARAGWNGKGMWLVYVPGTPDAAMKEGSPYARTGLARVSINGHIDMMTATGEMQPGWLASQTDMLSDDWCIVV